MDLSDAVPSWINPNAILTFPIKWTRTYLVETNDTKKDNGAINLDDFRAHFISTGVEEGNTEIPTEFLLSQNYPNPFNSSSTIRYSIPKSSLVTIKIFNSLGQELKNLINEEKTIGTYEIKWETVNLPSGVYFCRLQAGDFVQTRKMILMK